MKIFILSDLESLSEKRDRKGSENNNMKQSV